VAKQLSVSDLLEKAARSRLMQASQILREIRLLPKSLSGTVNLSIAALTTMVASKAMTTAVNLALLDYTISRVGEAARTSAKFRVGERTACLYEALDLLREAKLSCQYLREAEARPDQQRPITPSLLRRQRVELMRQRQKLARYESKLAALREQVRQLERGADIVALLSLVGRPATES
jgi:hypothetical protein